MFKLTMEQRNVDIDNDEIKIIVEANKNNTTAKRITDKVFSCLNEEKRKIAVCDGNVMKKIDVKEIIMFYSKDKNNYCKTSENEYKIKSSLKEVEKNYEEFIRISRNSLINMNYLKEFYIYDAKSMAVKLTDGTEVRVSRRQINGIMQIFDERMI